MKKYFLNKETNKIQLFFSKEQYNNLTPEQKKELKSSYLWSRIAKAWVSRSTKNHFFAIETAEKLGFIDGGSIGERLSYSEKIQAEAEKAKRKAERFLQYSKNAEKRAENLQSEFNRYHGDIAFFTQPNINSSSGKSFENYRNKVMDRYVKSFEEYRKSEYYREKVMKITANMEKFKDKVYLNNRINECKANIRKLQKLIKQAEQIQNQEWKKKLLSRIEYETDKLTFMENKLEEIGGISYSKESIKKGYLVKIRGTWSKVLKTNKKTVDIIILKGGAAGFELRYPYAEIQEVKIPEGWKEEKKEIKNPFKLGDILVLTNVSGNIILEAFQVIKMTPKTITIQAVEIKDNKPQKDNFKSKKIRRTVKKDRNNNFVVNYDNSWYLYKYVVKI